MQNQDRTPSTTSIPTSDTTVLESFPAGAPRGSWPAEEFAAKRRAEGINATVVMDLTTDTFKVVTI
ncbi:hypothetical protein [Streptomyces collinus]|uniref:hypothetical protein n=1 Tax=Streptomyces collinus TaxID=42684 RepID=UPI003806199B